MNSALQSLSYELPGASKEKNTHRLLDGAAPRKSMALHAPLSCLPYTLFSSVSYAKFFKINKESKYFLRSGGIIN